MTQPYIVSSKQLDPGVPFSLECCGCDAGMEIETPEQAVKLGWKSLCRDDWGDGMAWNYVGECPDCLRKEQQRKGKP